MILALLGVGGGIVLLTGGAEGLVRGASSLARRMGLSALVIGLTVVSVGTSLPELVVSLGASLQGSGSLALGNVVGSNISNIGLILGVAALVQPLRVEAQVVRVDVPLLVLASLLLVALILDGLLGRVDGMLLVAGIIAYLFYNVQSAQSEAPEIQEGAEEILSSVHSLWRDLGLVVLGIGGLLAGAHFLVEGAVHIARSLGVTELVIGLTVVAVGTSLPELATSVVAARRSEGDIAIGNAVGSSVFNILGILGVTAVVQPLSTTGLGVVETALMVGAAVVVLPLLRTGFLLGRREGLGLLLGYLGYLLYLAIG